MGAGEHPVLHDLKQKAPHVEWGFLQLVEQENRVGMLPDRFGELAAILMSHIPRGEPVRRLMVCFSENLSCRTGAGPPSVPKSTWAKALHSSVFPTPVGPRKRKAPTGRSGLLEPCPAPADGPGHGGHRLSLAGDPGGAGRSPGPKTLLTLVRQVRGIPIHWEIVWAVLGGDHGSSARPASGSVPAQISAEGLGVRYWAASLVVLAGNGVIPVPWAADSTRRPGL